MSSEVQGDAVGRDNDRLQRDLEDQRRLAAHWQTVAEERQRALDRLHAHPVVRLALRISRLVLPPVRRARWHAATLAQRLRRLGAVAREVPMRSRAGRRARHLKLALSALPATHVEGARVVAVIRPSRPGSDVSRIKGDLAADPIVSDVVTGPLTSAEGSGHDRADLVLFVDEDVQGVDDRWLARMVEACTGDVAAVGAQLVHPLGSPFGSGPGVVVASLGFQLEPAGREPPVVVAASAGVPPSPAGGVREVAGLTLSCLLVRRDALVSVGGIDTDLPADAAGLDLSWRLRQRGHRIVVQPGAVVWHGRERPSGPELEPQGGRVLEDRYGADMRRAALLDALHAERRLGSRPLRIEVIGSDEQAEEALGAACADLGWQVGVPGRTAPDVRFLVGPAPRLPRDGAVLVAWIGSDVPEWQHGGWLDACDVVAVRSPALADEVVAGTRRNHAPVVAMSELRSLGARWRDVLSEVVARPAVVVRIGAERREAPTWGDHHFAESFAAELRAAGCQAWVQPRDLWGDREGRGADVVVQLRGRGRSPRGTGQILALWVISHPEDLGVDEVSGADVVFVASSKLAQHVASLVDVPVHVLLQATDPWRFHPTGRNDRYADPVVFVGNSRFTERPMVRDALAAGLPLRVHGANWERYVPPRHLGERFIPNERVAEVYSSAAVVLNDHWPGMRAWGLVSNRIFDALAAGGCVVSDPLPELVELFGDAVATAEGPHELGRVVKRLLEDPEERAAMGRQGRDLVLAQHTFRHRATSFLAAVEPVRALRARAREQTRQRG